ncbi:MAG: DUF4249 family protein [Bacteroidota bacterium]
MRLRNNLRTVLGLLLLGWSLNSCLDEIPIELEEQPESGLVLQGQIVQGTPVSQVRVEILELFQFGNNVNRAVSNATVRIVKEGGESRLVPQQDLSGNYAVDLTQTDFPVAPGDRFRLEVSTSDTDDLIVSDWDELQETPQATALTWATTEVETVGAQDMVRLVPGIAFFISTPMRYSNGTPAKLRWKFIDAYRIVDDGLQTCYVENQYQANRVFLQDGALLAEAELTNFPLFAASIGIRHIDGYYLSVYQQSLSPASFQYWSDVQRLNEREGTIFDNPAGSIGTNWVNQTDSTRIVHGFFSAVAQDVIRVFVSREDMGGLPYYCPLPPPNGFAPAPTVCDDCLLYGGTGSSLNKPHYWP